MRPTSSVGEPSAVGSPPDPGRPSTCLDGWSRALEQLAREDPSVLVVVNDSVSSSGLRGFADRHPERVINVGIAEQNLVSVAAGLAHAGKTVFASSAAAFLTGRALEQIKIDVAYARANVTLIGQSPGVGYGPLGITHHAIEDLAWMAALPGMPVIAPTTPEETRASVLWAGRRPGCAYIRVPRALYGDRLTEPSTFTFGAATVLRPGDDVTIVACGATAGLAVAAGDGLARRGVRARVLAMSTVKPLDETALLQALRDTAGIVTVEDGLVAGLGAAVAAFAAEHRPRPMRRIGFRDEFACLGTDEFALSRGGITVDDIVTAAANVHLDQDRR